MISRHCSVTRKLFLPKTINFLPTYISTWYRGRAGRPHGIGCIWREIWRGVARISLRLASAIRSAVSFVIVTFLVFGVALGLIAFAAVSFFFLALRLVLGL